MALESAFKRLQLRPSSICHQCRRTLSSSAVKRTPQSATEAFAASLQASSASKPSSTAPPLSSTRTTSNPDRLVPRSSIDIATSTITSIGAAQQKSAAEQKRIEMERGWSKPDLERQVARRWRVGDVYAPHDLTGVEMAKWKKLRRRGKGPGGRDKVDVVDQLGINPVHHYKNFAMMSEYMSEMGRIKHSNETGLRPVNQRKMAKAIRRAIGTGLMPGVHRHPEILRIEMNARGPR